VVSTLLLVLLCYKTIRLRRGAAAYNLGPSKRDMPSKKHGVGSISREGEPLVAGGDGSKAADAGGLRPSQAAALSAQTRLE
jgi:hypothetical protein